MQPDNLRWTYHPVPRSEESLSSWLFRIALGNSSKLHTFCNFVWPGRSIWNRDVDNIADPAILDRVAVGTGVSRDRVHLTTFGSYAGRLYHERVGHAIQNLILPLGIYHRTRRRAGQQYCPKCLRESDHFRLTWRLAFMTVCVNHRCRLYDGCPNCGASIAFHRSAEPARCNKCKFKLTSARVVRANPKVVEFENRLIGLLTGQSRCMFGAVSEVDSFAILRHLCKTVGQRPRGLDLQRYIERKVRTRPKSLMPNIDFESRSIDERHAIMALLSWLSDEWPRRILDTCQCIGLWHSWILRDAGGIPNSFRNLIDRELLKPSYRDSCEARRRVRSISNSSLVAHHLGRPKLRARR